MQEHVKLEPVITDPDVQRGVWFLGALVKECLGSADTNGTLAILEHRGSRGYLSPMHRHRIDDETFLVLDGQVQMTIDGERRTAEAGTTVFLPRGVVHGFVVASARSKFLTVHTPSAFDRFAFEIGTPAERGANGYQAPANVVDPSPEELTRIAASFGIDIVGPPPAII